MAAETALVMISRVEKRFAVNLQSFALNICGMIQSN
jgi:ABC-type enterochelin transport system permease subunit